MGYFKSKILLSFLLVWVASVRVSGQLAPGQIIVGQTAGLWTANLLSNQGGGNNFVREYDIDHLPGNGREFTHSGYTFEDHGQFYYVEYFYGNMASSYKDVTIAGQGGYPDCFQLGDTIGPMDLNWEHQVNVTDPNGESSCHFFSLPEYYALRWVRSFSPPFDTVYGYLHNGTIFFGMPDTMSVGMASASLYPELIVYPNPANSMVQMKLLGESTEPMLVQLVNIEGRVVMDSQGISGQCLSMDVSALPVGIYQVVYSHLGHLKVKRLVIHR